MNPRYAVIQELTKRRPPILQEAFNHKASDIFGCHTFNRQIMQEMLPVEVYKNVVNAMDGQEKIKSEYADTISQAMKDWAMSRGATHYSHWFQPLTGATAEKHDAFIDWKTSDEVIEKFNGKQLVQGEPDASSFPSGGLRNTYEARGYTGWDPTSPAFLWSGSDGVTLCIPSVFFSWTGDVLDLKIPLLRSDKKISDAVMRLLKLTGISAKYVYSTLGCEQEYFVIDRAWRNFRPDLAMAGRTVYGAASPKGQELQDHYLGAIKDRVLCFMQDFETRAIKLAIPVKTRHNEVAPSQHEVAPIFERSSAAVDHNILLMELMRQTAVKHDLSCLLHEKPFHGINGSGKHCNWSLATDTGINLLNPTDTPENNLHFLVLLTAILNGVHRHAALLRSSIGSAANDHRLGGHEAPPPIISVYLGGELEAMLDSIETAKEYKKVKASIGFDLDIHVGPEMRRDDTDRNRTSPFAFTGNKFEFRAVGASASPSFPMTVLNTIVAESLNEMMDEIDALLGKKSTNKAIAETVFVVVRKFLKASRPIRFSGDNYSTEWSVEAKKRGLPIIMKSIEAFEAMKSKSTVAAFKGVLTKQELASRYEVLTETYCHNISIEISLMIDIFRTQILPAAIKQQRETSSSIVTYSAIVGHKDCLPSQRADLQKLSEHIERAIGLVDTLDAMRLHTASIKNSTARGKAYCETVLPLCEELRFVVDHIESLVEDSLWPLPKYREMLFLI